MIVVTGAAGFIGSCMVARLNELRYFDLVISDDFSPAAKTPNWEGKTFSEQVHRDDLPQWIDQHHERIQMIIHLGARTDTTEFNREIFDRLNVSYTKSIWNRCVQFGLPLIYASSAATYGLGEQGYYDDEAKIPQLKPLNPYGDSKNDFDVWALQQAKKPFFWAGLKFFNVYGPNENHKGRMASVIFHAFHQINQTGGMKLFRSHRPDFGDGEQSRDFVYVKDVVNMIVFLMEQRPHSGIFNVGSGQARSFRDLVTATFRAMDIEPNISFIDTPEDIRDTYQYFTEASMDKMRAAGYAAPFYSLEDGVQEYVQHYLIPGKTW